MRYINVNYILDNLSKNNIFYISYNELIRRGKEKMLYRLLQVSRVRLLKEHFDNLGFELDYSFDEDNIIKDNLKFLRCVFKKENINIMRELHNLYGDLL